jgi:hypothetical protein
MRRRTLLLVLVALLPGWPRALAGAGAARAPLLRQGWILHPRDLRRP